MAGILYGVGVGPGDPELLTLKALRLLQGAPVIVYPAPLEGESFARSIVAPHLPGGQIEIALRMEMSAAGFPNDAVYARGARDIGAHLDAGRDVVALCEGDPFFYGSFMYLYARVAQSHRVEVVPGVSSLTACAGVLGAPLASRGDRLAVLPATLPPERLRAALAEADAAAIIKVGRHLPKIRTLLKHLGLLGAARYIERATLANQRILDIDEALAGETPYFSMVLVHRRGAAWR